ncbi:MAG: hypothetical protein ACREQT_16835 [Candidatus Binataceae bacterium]
MSAPGIKVITRNVIVTLLGTPDHTQGELNSPIELEERGFHFNEKWLYAPLRGDPSGAPMRTIYWHRYDFIGTLVRDAADAEWRPDDTLIEAARRGDGRLANVTEARALLAGEGNYRAVSEVRDARDLGGYIEGAAESATRGQTKD